MQSFRKNSLQLLFQYDAQDESLLTDKFPVKRLRLLELLEARFGQKHNIAMANVDQVTNGPNIRAEDAECPEGFSILLSSCTNTLESS